MKIRAHRVLPCSIDTAWDALHTPSVFRYASWPLSVFRSAGRDLPERFRPETEYEVRVFALGVVPLGRQCIILTEVNPAGSPRSVIDAGHGISGSLAMLRNWRHEMTLSVRADGQSDFDDTLSVDARVLTPFLWPAMIILWWWRGRRLARRLAR